jgi:hypothetical protein
MNERIRELLEQAGVKYVTVPKDTVYEKFAQLIIQECVKSVTCNEALNILDRFGIDSEHFGVGS